jgi:uncharacterized repeat protein (TIGR01451 family)
VTKPNGSGAAFTFGSNSYYLSGVTAEPGDDLEYLLVAKNSSTTTAVTQAAINDLIPVDFVTFKAGAYGGTGKDVTYVDATGKTYQLSAAADTDTAAYNTTFDTTQNDSKGQLTVHVGTGATSSEGGSIPSDKDVRILYEVTVKP